MNIYCSECQAANREEADFCTLCGHPLSIVARELGKISKANPPDIASEAAEPAQTESAIGSLPKKKPLPPPPKLTRREEQEEMIARAVEAGIKRAYKRNHLGAFAHAGCHFIWMFLGLISVISVDSGEGLVGIILAIFAAAFLLIATRPAP